MDSISAVAAERDAHEEARLLALVARGDRSEPLEELYDRYARRVYGLGLRLLDDPGLAEDLVQETFVRLWRSAHRFDAARGSVRTFLFTLARRAAVDLWRRGRRNSSPLAPTLEAAVDADAYEELLLGLDVRAALDELTAKHREVLELHFDAGLTQRQISELLSIPLGTVKTRIYHALRALKDELADRGVVD
jgi:RNA polymerase sigma-70 factor (ECF subfamily)